MNHITPSSVSARTPQSDASGRIERGGSPSNHAPAQQQSSQQQSTPQGNTDQNRSQPHHDPAVSLSASLAHIDRGDIIAGHVQGVTAEGLPVVSSDRGTFIIETALPNDVKLPRGSDVKLEIIATEKIIEARIVTANNTPPKSDIPLKLIMIKTDLVAEQLPQPNIGHTIVTSGDLPTTHLYHRPLPVSRDTVAQLETDKAQPLLPLGLMDEAPHNALTSHAGHSNVPYDDNDIAAPLLRTTAPIPVATVAVTTTPKDAQTPPANTPRPTSSFPQQIHVAMAPFDKATAPTIVPPQSSTTPANASPSPSPFPAPAPPTQAPIEAAAMRTVIAAILGDAAEPAPDPAPEPTTIKSAPSANPHPAIATPSSIAAAPTLSLTPAIVAAVIDRPMAAILETPATVLSTHPTDDGRQPLPTAHRPAKTLPITPIVVTVTQIAHGSLPLHTQDAIKPQASTITTPLQQAPIVIEATVLPPEALPDPVAASSSPLHSTTVIRPGTELSTALGKVTLKETLPLSPGTTITLSMAPVDLSMPLKDDVFPINMPNNGLVEGTATALGQHQSSSPSIQTPSSPAAAAASQPTAGVMTDTALPMPFAAWPSLQMAISAMDPAIAAAVSSKIPSPEKLLTPGLLLFLNIFGIKSPARLLLDGTLDDNQTSSDETRPATRLDGDIARLRSLSADRGATEWRLFLLPFQNDNAIQAVPLMIRHNPGDDQKQNDPPQSDDSEQASTTRFILEVPLRAYGTVQFDGIIKQRSFDLFLKTDKTLSTSQQSHIQKLFSQALELNGFKGQILFRDGHGSSHQATTLMKDRLGLGSKLQA